MLTTDTLPAPFFWNFLKNTKVNKYQKHNTNSNFREKSVYYLICFDFHIKIYENNRYGIDLDDLPRRRGFNLRVMHQGEGKINFQEANILINYTDTLKSKELKLTTQKWAEVRVLKVGNFSRGMGSQYPTPIHLFSL